MVRIHTNISFIISIVIQLFNFFESNKDNQELKLS
jgi:hypothetical protein